MPINGLNTSWILCAALAAAASSGTPLLAQSSVFELEIPSANVTVRPRQTVAIPHEFVHRLRLTINKAPSAVSYGDIQTRINGRSANPVMTARGGRSSILCEFDLQLRPGYGLTRGRNSIEVLIRDFYGRSHYGSFLIDLQAGESRDPVPQIQYVNVGETASRPKLTLVEPLRAVSASAGRVTIRGLVQHTNSDVSVSVQGNKASVVTRPDDAPDVQRRDLRVSSGIRREFQFQLDIRPNLREIVVEVRDRAGRGVDARIPIVSGAQALDPVAEKYAVIIGVSKYQANEEGVQDLPFADDDAAAVRDLLLSPAGGFRPGNVITLMNEDATNRNMRSALSTFLTRPRENDLVLIYFAGHGAADPNNPIDHYFITHDTKPKDMGGTAYPMWHLRDVFTRTIKATRVVTFADACHSAGIGPSADDNYNLVNQSFQRHGSEQGRAVLTASDLGESSLESPKWGGGHGVFTHFLLSGATGRADTDADGRITVQELFDYVTAQVKRETGGRQNPVSMPGGLATQSLFELDSL